MFGPLVLVSDQILCLIVLEISGFSPFSKAKLPWKMVIIFFGGRIEGLFSLYTYTGVAEFFLNEI